MIQVKHYTNVFESDKKTVHHNLVIDYGESNVDLSTWRPEISVARAQAGLASGKRLVYDFPDGKDTGERVQTFIRSKGLDITEVETAEKRITQIIEDKKTSDDKKHKSEEFDKNLSDNLKKIADNFKPNESSDTISE